MIHNQASLSATAFRQRELLCATQQQCLGNYVLISRKNFISPATLGNKPVSASQKAAHLAQLPRFNGAWWEQLPGRTFDAQFAEAIRKEPNADPLVLLKHTNVQTSSGYAPPDFPGLADVPELRALCRQHWPTFQNVWGALAGEKLALANQQHTQLQRVRVDKISKSSNARSSQAPTSPLHASRRLCPLACVLPARYLRSTSGARR